MLRGEGGGESPPPPSFGGGESEILLGEFFFTGWWEPEEVWFFLIIWLFFKANSILWILIISITISMASVSKECEIKTMVQEQWLQLKMKWCFYWVITWKFLFSGGGIDFWWEGNKNVVAGESTGVVGGGRGFFQVEGGWSNFLLVGGGGTPRVLSGCKMPLEVHAYTSLFSCWFFWSCYHVVILQFVLQTVRILPLTWRFTLSSE